MTSQDEAVFTSVLTSHLGFEAVPETNRHLWPRLEELRRAGLLATVDHRGEPLWGLTTVGRPHWDAIALTAGCGAYDAQLGERSEDDP